MRAADVVRGGQYVARIKRQVTVVVVIAILPSGFLEAIDIRTGNVLSIGPAMLRREAKCRCDVTEVLREIRDCNGCGRGGNPPP